MTVASVPAEVEPIETPARVDHPDGAWSRITKNSRIVVSSTVLGLILVICFATLPWATHGDPPLYAVQLGDHVRQGPSFDSIKSLFGYDTLGRSLLVRCLIGGCISLAIGVASALISVVIGVAVGLFAGYRGGWIDAVLMRSVDVLYGLPYVLLVILFKIAFEQHIAGWMNPAAANLIVLFLAIGLVSWLTMARVIRGQVLSIRSQPYIEACKALGLPEWRIFLVHILPNLAGVIIVYATLTVPVAILQESFLSFLGVGINPPMPTWGSLSADAVASLNPVQIYWWLLLFPCSLLVVTLLSLNFLGDGLRDVYDPRHEAKKI